MSAYDKFLSKNELKSILAQWEIKRKVLELKISFVFNRKNYCNFYLVPSYLFMQLYNKNCVCLKFKLEWHWHKKYLVRLSYSYSFKNQETRNSINSCVTHKGKMVIYCPGGTQIWVEQGCAARASKPLPIFKGDFGRTGYPFLRIYLEK